MAIDLIKRKEDFEYWLTDMDDALDRFFGTLPQSLRSRLDYTEESLDALEHWILDRCDSPSALLEPSSKELLDGLARYVGETFRKQIGGHWEIRLDDPKYAFFGIPQLTGFSDKPTPVSAHSLVTASTDRRTGTYLRTVLQNTKKRLR